MTSPRARYGGRVLLVMLAVLTLVVAFLAVAGGRQLAADARYHPITVPAATAAPSAVSAALAALAAAPTTVGGQSSVALVPSASGLSAALSPLVTVAALGATTSAQVVEPVNGQVLYARNADATMSPASTAKLLVAAAVLTTFKPTDQFFTTVVSGPGDGSVVLVGGGDPTLTSAAATEQPAYSNAARMTDLAAMVRSAVGSTPISAVAVDGSLFTGPTTAQGWGTGDAPSEYASAITAVMVDGGRNRPTDVIRSASPDLAAGRALAADLGVTGAVTTGTAVAGATVLGRIGSASVSRLVEQMLADSDNVIAEVLARQVARATGKPLSFVGAAAAVSAVLMSLGMPVGDGMRDASGLSGLDRIPVASLAAVLTKALDPTHAALHPIIAGLAVAGWSGTLAPPRFAGAAASAVGDVRAKTGTLDGVAAEAGVVTDQEGRVLVFVIVSNSAPSIEPARAALDRIAAALAACGCP